MKAYTVIVPTWVAGSSISFRTVNAQFVKIVDGVLYFYNGRNETDRLVMAFATGMWSSFTPTN